MFSHSSTGLCLLFLLTSSFALKGQESQANLNRSEKQDTVYYEVDQSPDYPGSRKGLISYIHAKVAYPEKLVKDSLEGSMTIKFMVTKNGIVRNPNIVDSISPAIHAQILQALNNMPHWKPGYKNGEPVNTWVFLPLSFNLTWGGSK